VDFGFATRTDDKNTARKQFDSSFSIGSPGYNSPEQMNTNFYYADDADLFAAGCVLFQMVVNSSPFKNS
jgi:serine/threonine protein kinase